MKKADTAKTIKLTQTDLDWMRDNNLRFATRTEDARWYKEIGAYRSYWVWAMYRAMELGET